MFLFKYPFFFAAALTANNRNNVLSKIYDILEFLNFLYLALVLYFLLFIFTILTFLESIENKLVYCNKILPFKIIPTNPIQTYQHILEFYACILKIFCCNISVAYYFFSFNYISICSTLKLSKYVTSLDASPLSPFTYRSIQ